MTLHSLLSAALAAVLVLSSVNASAQVVSDKGTSQPTSAAPATNGAPATPPVHNWGFLGLLGLLGLFGLRRPRYGRDVVGGPIRYSVA